MHLDLPQRYELADDPVLGQGGMGRVLRARDVVLDVPVALKVVRPDRASDPRFQRLFELEVRISARFDHPHVVPLHDHGVTELGTPYLGLALADAGSFAKFREAPVDWYELTRLTLQLLDALAHLHARGVYHRDLKPENVLLHTGEAGLEHVWLADLGLASAASDLARVKGRTEGTPGFMAPEQRLGLPREYGPWTDLYAVGVILWEAVTGRRPFRDSQTALDGPLPPFRPRPGIEVPTELHHVLANLLCPEPLSRYDLASDLRTELLALSESTLSPNTQSIDLEPVGTVAPSADELPSDIEMFDPAVAETSDLFQLTTGEIEVSGFDPNIPLWNRPLPRFIPEEPPSASRAVARAAASLRLFALRETPLVGREAHQRALWTHARKTTIERKPRVVLVVGESGAGKGRLVDSVVFALQEGGWAESLRLSWQRMESADDGYAGAARALLKPWNESRASLSARLRRRLARERGRYDDTIKREADTLARWSGLGGEEDEPVAEGLGLREVYRHLEARTWRGLACLVLSDVGWCRDEGDGLAIAEAMLATDDAGVRDKPLLVIATVRKEQLHSDPELAARVAALEGAGAYRMDLPRLGRPQTLELLQGSLRLAQPLAERVVERCEGNPLFARQLLMEWTARGWLVDVGDLTYDLAPGVDADAVLPQDAEDLFAERVERLAEASGAAHRFRDAVDMAALAGRTLPRALLMDLSGEQLADFVLGCGLYVAHDDWVSVDGNMLHQAILQAAEDRTDAAYLHRRLGRAWVRHAERSGADVAMAAARHARAGLDWALCAAQSLLAAERALARGRIHDLDETSRIGFEVIREHEELWEHWGRAALLRGRALQLQGDANAALEAFREATAKLPGSAAAAVGEALCGQGWSWLQQGRLDEAERAYAQAVERGRAARDPRSEAVAVAGKAWVEQQRRNFDGAAILFARAVNMLGRLDDMRSLGEATLGQAFVARRTGDFGEAAALYDEADEAFGDGEDALGQARARLGKALALRQLDQLDAADALLTDAHRNAEELGAMQVLMDVRLARAGLLRARGDGARAARVFQDNLTWSERHGAFESRIEAQLGLAQLALDRDDLDGALSWATQAVQLLEKVPGHWLWATYRLTVATLLARRGQADETWEWLWSAEELGLRDTVDVDAVDCLERIHEVARDEGWTRVARLAAKLLVPQLRRLGRVGRLAALDGSTPS